MSQYYDMGDQTLWNPSNGASRLFMSQVSVYQAELGLPSGIGPMQADECQIDPLVPTPTTPVPGSSAGAKRSRGGAYRPSSSAGGPSRINAVRSAAGSSGITRLSKNPMRRAWHTGLTSPVRARGADRSAGRSCQLIAVTRVEEM